MKRRAGERTTSTKLRTGARTSVAIAAKSAESSIRGNSAHFDKLSAALRIPHTSAGSVRRSALLLLSGGIDSATCGAIARRDGYSLYAMSFCYGQRHVVELDAAHRVADALDVRDHRIVDIDLRVFGGSALTSDTAVPKGRSLDNAIPITYVPARNTIFLSYALAWAEVLGIADIFIGVNAVDYSGYPDCRPEYIAAFEKMANLATRAAVEGARLTIHTPLISMTKAEIITTGVSLGLDYGLTHSCYDPTPDGFSCGSCDSCAIRRQGFAQAGVADPTRYA